MNHVNAFAVMVNSNAQIIYCNGHFVRMTGLSLDEVMGRNWSDVFVSLREGLLPVPFSNCFRIKADGLHHEGVLLTRGGERYWVRWNSTPLRDSSGTIFAVASIGEDITERRRSERASLDASVRERVYREG
jgi:PAS domain S-box-containing protein